MRHLSHCKTPRERLVALLDLTVNTQSQPKMGKLGPFWRSLSKLKPGQAISREYFLAFLEGDAENDHSDLCKWYRLFNALQACDGWGKKTAALFVRNVIYVHRGPKELHFWEAPTAVAVANNARIFLPVDEVIITIFKELGKTRNNGFDELNDFLSAGYGPEQMLLWDDLWFWGYFTQMGKRGERTMGWNQDKFWCQPSAPTGSEAALRLLGARFVKLVGEARDAK